MNSGYNKLEKKFNAEIEKKVFVKRSTVWHTDSLNYLVDNYYLGYNKKNQLVNDANSDFYEYDAKGRVTKCYSCWLQRDPHCNKPFIYLYEYKNDKISVIRMIESFNTDTAGYVYETYRYDSQGRLVEKVRDSRGTIAFEYSGNDTMPSSITESPWESNYRTWNHHYVNGIKDFSFWDNNGTSYKRVYSYNDKGRLVFQKDSILDNILREPNTCCISYLHQYKYADNGRMIEDVYLTEQFDYPSPYWVERITYEYDSTNSKKY